MSLKLAAFGSDPFCAEQHLLGWGSGGCVAVHGRRVAAHPRTDGRVADAPWLCHARVASQAEGRLRKFRHRFSFQEFRMRLSRQKKFRRQFSKLRASVSPCEAI